jgi:thiosulfate/3-mercaptopyruvate sulfurtransferase
MYCDIDDVKTRKDLPQVILIDSREHNRYTGKVEKLYKKAGHIPGAKNFYSRNNFHQCFIKSKKNLFQQWDFVEAYDEIILYCGSGIAASVNALVLDELGYSSKLYLGSFSDWISYPHHQVEKN